MKNRNYLKKAISLLLTMMMVFSLSATAFAAEQPQVDNQIHVVFTRDCTSTFNDGEDYYYEWGTIAEPTGNQVILDAGYVTLSNDLLNGRDVYASETPVSLVKKYFSAEPSILDVIYAAAVQAKSKDYVTIGADTDPERGDPGAFVSQFGTYAPSTEITAEHADGTVDMKGSGVFVAVQAPGATSSNIYDSISFPEEYVSNVAAEAGTTIYVDYGYFEYYNVKLS